MSDDTKSTVFLRTPSEVAEILKIQTSTLRKYALLLQNAGYKFSTNEKGQRAYLDEDVTTIRRFLDFKETRDITLEKAANAFVTMLKESGVSLSVIENDESFNRYNDDIKELKEGSHFQTALLKKMLQQMHNMEERQKQMEEKIMQQQRHMDQQQLYIESSLIERDEKVMEALNKSLEDKRLLLEAHVAEKKKGFFARLFGK